MYEKYTQKMRTQVSPNYVRYNNKNIVNLIAFSSNQKVSNIQFTIFVK